jgi:hypothetical protein
MTIHIRCKAYVCKCKRCKRMFVNVSFVLDVCFSKSFILQVLHDQTWEVGATVPACVREAKRARRPPHACIGACVPLQHAGPGWQAQQQRADMCGSSVPMGRQELHACTMGPSRQSGRQRHDARVPSVGRMHPWKCVVYAISYRIRM